MFENFSQRLDRAFKNLKGQGRISELNIAETVKEIRKALLEADVNFLIAKKFTETIKQRALGEKVLTSVSPGQQMVKIVNDELTELLGGEKVDLNIKSNPAIILIAGLQGSGKTTFSGKLALHLKGKAKNPLLVAGDVYRPAAINQLHVLGEQVGVQVYSEPENKNPVSIALNALKHARANQHQAVIIDTAGRLGIDEAMMNEIAAVRNAVQPHEILFVVDSMTGQDAVNTAKAFNDRLDFSGVVLTKLDGDTRGGAALSIKSVVNKPIKFISNGEKMEALDIFYPERMAQRILGMGDIVSLVEKAQQSFDKDEAERLQQKLRRNEFTFQDFFDQLQQLKKMGNLKDIMAMIPGVGKAIKDVDLDDKNFKSIEALIQAMTPYEREHPDVLSGARKKRIADGSGRNIQELNQLIKQFDEMRKMMKTMNKMRSTGAKMGMPKMPMR